MRMADRLFAAAIVLTGALSTGWGPPEQSPRTSTLDSVQSERPARAAALRQREAAEAALAEAVPGVELYKQGDRTTRVFGRAFSRGDSAVASAEAFRTAHAPAFGVAAADLKPGSLMKNAQHVQPVMFMASTGAYKFTLVCYRQHLDDLPVVGADLRVLVRNEPGFPAVLASSGLRDVGGLTLDPNVRQSVAQAAYVQAQFAVARQAAVNAHPTLVNFSPPNVVVWAGGEGRTVQPRIALEFIADNFAPNGPSNEKWRIIADVATGAILQEEFVLYRIDGHAGGNVTEGIGADFCEAEVPTPMPYLTITSGANATTADANGDYSLPPDGATVDATLADGQWFDVRDFVGPVESLSLPAATPANFSFNAANTDEFIRAQANGYRGANVIRDFVLQFNPSYPTFTDTDIPCWVNRTDGFCPGNAWYDPADAGSPTGYSINFCRTGGGSPNTAWSSVIYHEFGHHLVRAAGSGQDQYGEGTGDCMSVIILDDPHVGLGFFGTCDDPGTLRSAESGLQYPCSIGAHACAPLLAGCIWDTRNELIVTEPDDYRSILGNLMVNSILLHTGSLINPQITIDWLTLDDDDGNIFNGTPHYQEICAGFGMHNMNCPALQQVFFDYPQGRPALVAPNEPTPVAVNVSPVAGTPVPGTGSFFYRLNPMGPFFSLPMTETGPNAYVASLPASDCLQTIQYFFRVQLVEGGFASDPPNAPTNLFSTVAAQGISTLVELDFEVDPGWSVSSTATDGAWNRGVPVNCNRGDPPADFDGSGQCWLTDNSAANSCNSDIDNGVTTLTSTVMDLSGLDNPQVRYARWFSNVLGSAPESDTLVVEISTNGGFSWSNLETVGPTTGSANGEVAGGWFLREFPVPAASEFRIRFIAEDVNPQSIVEAAVDGFAVTHFLCLVCDAATGDLNGVDGPNGADIRLFVDGLLGAPTDPQICAGDFNGNLMLDIDDTSGMVDAMLAGP